MADEPDPNASPSESDVEGERGQSSPRRPSLTPAKRKFMGPGRSWHQREAAKEEAAEASQAPPPAPSAAADTSETQLPAGPPWPQPAQAIPPPPKPQPQRNAH